MARQIRFADGTPMGLLTRRAGMPVLTAITSGKVVEIIDREFDAGMPVDSTEFIDEPEKHLSVLADQKIMEGL